MGQPLGVRRPGQRLGSCNGTGYGAIRMANEPSVPSSALHRYIWHGGHLYMQTNEIQNAVIHYVRSANGTITEVERQGAADYHRGKQMV
jgi:hypothetical protein